MLQKTFDQGEAARRSGVPESKNPYAASKHQDLSNAWRDGWMSADDEITGN